MSSGVPQLPADNQYTVVLSLRRRLRAQWRADVDFLRQQTRLAGEHVRVLSTNLYVAISRAAADRNALRGLAEGGPIPAMTQNALGRMLSTH